MMANSEGDSGGMYVMASFAKNAEIEAGMGWQLK